MGGWLWEGAGPRVWGPTGRSGSSGRSLINPSVPPAGRRFTRGLHGAAGAAVPGGQAGGRAWGHGRAGGRAGAGRALSHAPLPPQLGRAAWGAPGSCPGRCDSCSACCLLGRSEQVRESGEPGRRVPGFPVPSLSVGLPSAGTGPGPTVPLPAGHSRSLWVSVSLSLCPPSLFGPLSPLQTSATSLSVSLAKCPPPPWLSSLFSPPTHAGSHLSLLYHITAVSSPDQGTPNFWVSGWLGPQQYLSYSSRRNEAEPYGAWIWEDQVSWYWEKETMDLRSKQQLFLQALSLLGQGEAVPPGDQRESLGIPTQPAC